MEPNDDLIKVIADEMNRIGLGYHETNAASIACAVERHYAENLTKLADEIHQAGVESFENRNMVGPARLYRFADCVRGLVGPSVTALREVRGEDATWKDVRDMYAGEALVLPAGMPAVVNAEELRMYVSEQEACEMERDYVPTRAMLEAARDWSLAKYGQAIGNDAATGCWQAMYDAKMNPPPESVADANREAINAHFDELERAYEEIRKKIYFARVNGITDRWNALMDRLGRAPTTFTERRYAATEEYWRNLGHETTWDEVGKYNGN